MLPVARCDCATATFQLVRYRVNGHGWGSNILSVQGPCCFATITRRFPASGDGQEATGHCRFAAPALPRRTMRGRSAFRRRTKARRRLRGSYRTQRITSVSISVRGVWAKCDMLATVGFAPLDFFHTTRDLDGKRRYLHPKLSDSDLQRVRQGILFGIGLGNLTLK
jgi:hypothetical protein